MNYPGKERFLTVALVALLAAGCGGGDGGGSAGGDAGGGDAPAAPAASPVDAATAGNISGTIAFEGAAPEMATIDMSEEAACADKHSGAVMVEEVVVGDGLANVFVYVSAGPHEGLAFPTPGDAVVVDQVGCVYTPHVIGVQAGQDILIRNSDPVLHNINASPETNRGFNFGQPVEGMESTRSFPLAEVMVPVRCDVHGWMSAYIGVVDHPYYSVSGANGQFSLETLPPGDYTVTAWHERYGVQTEQVTVATGETADVTFTFGESMAGRPVPLGEPVDFHDHGSTQQAPAGQ